VPVAELLALVVELAVVELLVALKLEVVLLLLDVVVLLVPESARYAPTPAITMITTTIIATAAVEIDLL
jgi:hypothetical protein